MNSTENRMMHSLVGTFIEDNDPETCQITKKIYFPIKIIIPPNKVNIYLHILLKLIII